LFADKIAVVRRLLNVDPCGQKVNHVTIIHVSDMNGVPPPLYLDHPHAGGQWRSVAGAANNTHRVSNRPSDSRVTS